MTTCVIVNPASRNGRTGKRWEKLSGRLRDALGGFETRITTAPGHATEHARGALKAGAGRIISVGGDGTLSEIVNGFFEHGEPVNPKAVLGVMPAGTGSDFARSLDLPRNQAGCIAALKRARTRAIDIGVLEYQGLDGDRRRRYFANVTSFGLTGQVARAVQDARWPKRLGGPFAYAAPAIKALANHNNTALRLRFDGGEKWELTSAFIVAANGRYCGGGLKIAPDARLANGALDVVIAGDISGWDGLAWIGRLYRGTHMAHPRISFRRATGFTVEAIDPEAVVAVEADGEPLGKLPAKVGIMRRAIEVIVGGGGFDTPVVQPLFN